MQPQVVKNVGVDAWLNEIVSGNQFKSKIDEARAWGKGCDQYDSIKSKLPAVTWNFHFDGYKKDSNIKDSTGFLYYDIDDVNFNTEILDKSKVFSFFSSLSNKGISIIVKVAGLTKENFNATYEEVATDLGIGRYIDCSAIKKTQFTVLTHDPNAFINHGAVIFSASSQSSIESQNKTKTSEKVSLALNKEKREERHIGANDTFFQFNNLYLYSNPKDVVVNADGWDIVSLYLPNSIKEGKRKNTLLSYCNNLVLLNPDKTPEQVFYHLMNRNELRCDIPLREHEVIGIVNSIFKYKQAGTLEFKEVKKRKIIFGQNCGMDKKDKMSFAAQTVAGWKKDKTRLKIYEAIENNSNMKITAKSVSIDSGLGIATVKRYWPEFKEFVKEQNRLRRKGVSL